MRFDKTTREIFVYDAIGATSDGYFGAPTMAYALKEIGPGRITVRLNSPGGSVFEMWAMLEQLERHNGSITVTVDGLAASAASALLLAGHHRSGGKESVVMVHRPWTVAIGDYEHLRDLSYTMEMATEKLANFYSSKLRVSRSVVDGWLAKDTYFDADESLKHGFYHQIGSGVAATVSASDFPKRDAAAKKLRERAAFSAVDRARREMQARYERATGANSFTKTLATATQESNFPLRTAAKLQILKRQLERHTRK